MSQWTGQPEFRFHQAKKHPLMVAPYDIVDMFAIFSLRRPDILPVGEPRHSVL